MQQTLLITRLHGEDEYDYIKRDKALEAAITALEWISVEDRLPDKHEVVNVKFKDGRYSNCWIQSTGEFAYNTKESITHWKPLPPKEQDDEDKN